MALSAGDEQRARDLRRMRLLATGLLVLAAVVYLVSLPWSRSGWTSWVNAASEAAMVGALADWFAVTALFRHPLGLPIPHTALVRRRKNELGRSLEDFVTHNFLTVEILQERVREAELPSRVGSWLHAPANRNRCVAQLTRGTRALLSKIDEQVVTECVEQTILPALGRMPVSGTAGRLLEQAVIRRAHEPLVESLARQAHEWLKANPEATRRVIIERAPSWSPSWLDRTVVDHGYRQALEWTMAVRMQRHHPARLALTNFLVKLSDDLQHDEVVMDKAESIKRAILANSAIAPTAVRLWDVARTELLQQLDDPSSQARRWLDGWLKELGTSLGTDRDMVERVQHRIDDAVAFLAETYGSELTSVISTTVDRWDADEASDRIELFVGRDLQFIRINGTVVGALAGLAIHALGLLVTRG